MKHLLSISILLLAFGIVAEAQSPPTAALTLQDALQLLRTANPTLAAAQAHAASLRGNEITAGFRPNPVFTSANEDFRPSNLDIKNAQEFTDSVAWTFERGGKRSARVQSALLSTTVGRDQLADVQRQLEFQVKVAFTNVLFAKAALGLAQSNASDYARVIEANALRLKAGDISQTDFDRIKLQEAQFQSDVLNAQMALQQSRSQLGALLGIADANRVDVAGTLVSTAPGFALDDLQAKALTNRPDFLAAHDSVRKANADLRLSTANGATDFSFAPEYKRNGPDNTVGFSIQVPLRIFDRNQGEKLRTSLELKSAELGENAARLQVISDVAQTWAAFQAAQERARLYNSDYLNRARDVRDRVQFSFEHGATNLLDYLDAIRSYRDIELASMNANAQVLAAIHQLSFVTATELMP